MPIIDIVNFNGDASCLDSGKWLRMLRGGTESPMVRFLRHYVDFDRRVVLGMVGATVEDIAHFNPEAIQLINRHPDVFDVLFRPFAHDSPLLRLPNGFRFNISRGLEVLSKHFDSLTWAYLPPEHMVTAEQISILADLGVAAVFLHTGRYSSPIRRAIPDATFPVYGVLDATLPCIPFAHTDLEDLSLRALRGTVSPQTRSRALIEATAEDRDVFLWRDGESCFLWPLGLDYQQRLLESEVREGVERALISQVKPWETCASEEPRFFPLQSLKPWLDEMKLLWLVSRIAEGEKRLADLSPAAQELWLLTINSDVMSAAEKSPPVLDASTEILRVPDTDPQWDGVLRLTTDEIVLCRSERFGEGEDYLAYFDRTANGEIEPEQVLDLWRESSRPHLQKAYARVAETIRNQLGSPR